MITFTKQDLLVAYPCAEGLQFAKRCKFDFAKIYATCDRDDWLIWLLRAAKAIDKKQAVQIANRYPCWMHKEFKDTKAEAVSHAGVLGFAIAGGAK